MRKIYALHKTHTVHCFGKNKTGENILVSLDLYFIFNSGQRNDEVVFFGLSSV